jgi:GTPase
VEHKSGFVNIIGRPNVGKSTLMNALVGERMSIITNKPQTTRHRIIGIVSTDEYQIVFSDTPGVVRNPIYKMHEAMNSFVKATFEDSDVMIFVTEPADNYDDEDIIIERLKKIEVPLFLVVNKIDVIDTGRLNQLFNFWKERIPNFKECVGISALKKTNLDGMIEKIVSYLPEGPEYYPKDQLTDKPERFFISEIIREKILNLYSQEIPYASEVTVDAFKEGVTTKGEPIVRIMATIYVGRDTQKSIILGKGGTAIKRLGTEARKGIEVFLEKKVFLELSVKVKDNWRDNEQILKGFGYTL